MKRIRKGEKFDFAGFQFAVVQTHGKWIISHHQKKSATQTKGKNSRNHTKIQKVSVHCNVQSIFRVLEDGATSIPLETQKVFSIILEAGYI